MLFGQKKEQVEEKKFDLKVHHKDGKGRLYKITPYRRHESKHEGVWYERNGMKYAENGDPIGLASSCPDYLKSYEVTYRTQGLAQVPQFTSIPNDDVPAPGLTVQQTKDLEAKRVADQLQETHQEVVEQPQPKKRGRPPKVKVD